MDIQAQVVEIRHRIAGWLVAWLVGAALVLSSPAQTVSFQTPTAAVSESATNLILVVTRTPASGVATASFLTVAGTAAALQDFIPASGVLTFGANEVFKLITVPIVNDTTPEAGETFSVVLTNVTGATLGIGTNVVTILDDDSFYSFSSTNLVVSEGATNLFVNIDRLGSTGVPGTVRFFTLDGTNAGFNALDGVDYQGTNTLVTFAPGQTNALVPIPIIDNLLAKTAPQFLLVLTNPVAGQLGTPAFSTVTILDNDDPGGTLQIASPPQLVFENGATNVIITVSRLGGSLGTVGLSYGPLNGNPLLPPGCAISTNAIDGVDYTGASGTLTWPTGDNTDRFIVFPLVDDNLVEANELIVIGLLNTTNGIINTNILGIVNIISDDAPPGAADPLFNLRGLLNPTPGANNNVMAAVVVTNAADPNFGQIMIGGDFTAVNSIVRNRVARLNADGTVDTTFNPGTGADGVVNAIVMQPDGRILIAGGFTSYNNLSRRGVARLNADGTLDATFDPGTGVAGTVNAMVLLSDGRIVLAGGFDSVNSLEHHTMVRLNANGSVDGSFNVGEGADQPITALASDFVPPLNPPAVLSSIASVVAFPNATNGNHTHGFGPTVEVGSFSSNEEMRGVAEFSLGGRTFISQATLRFQFAATNGLLGQTGSVFNITLEAFGANGVQDITDFEAPALATLTNFSTTNFTIGDQVALDVTAVANQAIAGGFTAIGFRLRPTSDPGIDAAVQFGSFQLAGAAAGSIFVGGDFGRFNRVPRNRLVRINGDGTVDFSFNPILGPDGPVLAMLMTTTNRLLMGGAFQSFDGQPAGGLVKLSTTGLIDPTFDPQGGVKGVVRAMVLQTNGQPIIAGDFTSLGGVARTNLARLYGNGSLDTSFLDPYYNATRSGTDGPVFALSLQPDGDVIIGGSFRQIGAGLPPTDVANQFNYSRIRGGDILPAFNMAGNVIIGSSTFQVDENALGGVVNVNILRVNGHLGHLEVTYSTVDGTAIAGRDYAATTGTLTFADCDPVGINQFFAVPILNNSVLDGNRTFQVVLSIPRAPGFTSLPARGFTHRATVTIVDDEFEVGTVGFASTVYSVDENIGGAVVQLVRTNGSTGFVTVQYGAAAGSATPGLDFTPVSGTASFVSGQSTTTFTVPVINDTAVEFEETVLLSLTNATGGAQLGLASAALLIQDNENGPGTIGFSADRFNVAESAGSVTINVLRTSGTAGAVTASVATLAAPVGVPGAARDGVDFGPVTTNLVFAAGESLKTLTVPVFEDRLVEGTETFQMILTNVTGGASTGYLAAATVNILDDDGHGRVGFASRDFYINERQTNAIITLVRTDGSSDVVEVDLWINGGSATETVDFTASTNRVIFADSETEKIILVPLVNDGLHEGAETAQLTLTNFSKALPGPVTNALLTIFDDEAVSVPAGTLDATFFSQVGGFVQKVLVQPDGRILIAGTFTNYTGLHVGRIARLNPTGLLDPTFRAGLGADDAVHDLALTPDGKILIGGSFRRFDNTNRAGIARLNLDGTLDTSFNPGAGFDGVVYSLLLRDNGSVLVGGAFLSFNGGSAPYLVKLSANGTRDNGFSGVPLLNARVLALAGQRNGQILVGGEFTNAAGSAVGRLLRLQPDGRLDTAFSAGLGADGSVRVLRVLADDRIMVGGSFTGFNGATRGGLIRLNRDGDVDPAFDPGGPGADGAVLAVLAQPDGRILIGGDFARYGAIQRGRIARLLPDGTLDPGINFGSGADNFVAALATQPDEKIVVGGGFARFDGVATSYLARLVGGENAGAGRFEFPQAGFVVEESGGTGTVLVRRTGGLKGDVSVDFSTADGSAQNGVHYFAVSNRIAFAQNEVEKAVNVQVINNSILDSNRVVNLLLSSPAGGAGLAARTNAVLTIADDDMRIGFSTGTYTVNENTPSGQAAITVLRAGATNVAVLVGFTSTTNGSAQAGADFVPVSGTLRFGPGETTKQFTVSLIDDAEAEPVEAVGLALTNFQFAAVSSATILPGLTNANLLITDDELAPGELTFASPTFSVSEDLSTVLASVQVVRTNGSSGLVTVNYLTADGTARAGQDYSAVSGVLSFADGENSKTFTLPVLADGDSEPTETVNLTLANPTGGAVIGAQGTAVLFINNNDVLIYGNLAFESAAVTNLESDASAVLTVRRIGGTNGAIGVDFAIATNGTAVPGVHFTPVSGSLSWAAGDAAPQVISVPLRRNFLVDGDQTVVVQLQNPSALAQVRAPAAATIFIRDVDTGPGVLGFELPLYDVREDGTNVVVGVVRTNGTSGTVTVQFDSARGANDNAVGTTNSGPALPAEHYRSVSGSLTFTNGVARQTFTVPVLNNLVQDGTRTFSLRLSATTGGAVVGLSNAVVRITDDERTAGGLDPQFFPGTGPDGTVYAISVSTNGQTLVGGDFQTFDGRARGGVARLNLDGTLDTTFNSGVWALGLTNRGSVRAIAAYTNGPHAGKVLVGGLFNNVNGVTRSNLVRLNLDGGVDPTFDPGLGANSLVQAVRILDNSKTLVAGSFTTLGGLPRGFVGRLNADGSVDPTFDPGFGPDAPVRALAVQTDGKVLIAGGFNLVSGVTNRAVARLNADGAVDGTFAVGGLIATGEVFAVAVQLDGKVLAGGSFTTAAGVARNNLLRLNPDGSHDAGFDPGSGPNDFISSLVLQPDQRLLVAGGFVNFGGVAKGRIVRLNADGRVDPTINFGLGANDLINAIAWPGDGRILLGGAFTQFNRADIRRLVRLDGGDNVGPGRLMFAQGVFQVSEAGTNAVIEVLRLGGLTGRVGTDYSVVPGGTAVESADYFPVGGTLTFEPAENFKSFLVPVIDDTAIRPSRNVRLALTNATAGVTLAIPPTADLIIHENDSLLGFSSPTYSVNESAPGALISVTRTGGTNEAVAVDFLTTNLTALDGVDYSPVSGTLNFAAGVTNLSFIVPILNDSLIEDAELVTLLLTNPQPVGVASLGTADNAVLRIIDDEFAPGVLGFVATNYVQFEGVAVARISVVRTNGSAGAVSVNFATLDGQGTALPAVDYLSTNGVLSFADGETTKHFEVRLIDDLVVEGNETVALRLSGTTGGALLGLTNASLTLIEDDAFGSIEFATNSFAISEAVGGLDVAVRRVGGTVGQVSADFSTVDGTAVAGVDFQSSPRVLIFQAGQTATNVVIPIINDFLVEPVEFFTLTLGRPTFGAILGTITNAVVSITDDDFDIQFASTNFNVFEDGTNAVITVVRSGVTNITATFDYFTVNGTATNGVDYVGVTNSLRLDQGSLSTNFIIPIIDNPVVQANRSLFLFLTNAAPTNVASVGLRGSAQLTILDNDNFFTFSALSYVVNENVAGGNAQISVLRFGQNTGTVSVAVTTSPGTATPSIDYTNSAQTVAFAPGVSNFVALIGITDDTLAEGDETFFVHLSLPSPAGAATLEPTNAPFLTPTNVPFITVTNTSLVTIIENDTEVSFLGTNFAVNETVGSAMIDVRRAGVTNSTVGVAFSTTNGTAINGLDYIGTNAFLSFAPGVTNLTVAVLIINDNVTEPAETVLLQLANPTNALLGAASNAVLTIVDNVGSLGFVASSFIVGENGTNALISVARVSGSAGAISVAFATANGSAGAGLDYVQINGTLNWTDGDTGIKSFLVGIVDDGVIETNEFLNLVLSAPSGGAVIGSNATAVLVIVDNDGPSGVDFDFRIGAGFNDTVYGLARQTNGQILAGGAFTSFDGTARSRVARLNLDGTLDPLYNAGLGPDALVRAIALQPNGLLVVGGDFASVGGFPRQRVARMTADGSLDLTFVPGTGANGSVHSLAVQDDGRVLVGGAFTTFAGSSIRGIARLNVSGSLDSSFNPGLGAAGTVNALAVYRTGTNEGKILLGGSFTNYAGVSAGRLVRINANGSRDASFNVGTGADNVVSTIAIQADDRVVVGGLFTSINGVSRTRLARLNHDGSLDSSLAPVLDDAVHAVTFQSDGSIVVGGNFTFLGGTGIPPLPGQPASSGVTNINRISRFRPDGSIDTLFINGNGANNLVLSLLVQPDQKIVLGGAFTSVNDTTLNRIARLNGNLNGAMATLLSAGTMNGTGRFELMLAGEPGRTFEVQVSTDLRTWTPIGTVQSGAGTVMFVDTNSTGTVRRFYRAVKLAP